MRGVLDLRGDRAENLLCSLLPRPKRKPVRDTWEPIDTKLGAYVRGQAVLIVLVGAVLSLVFWAIGLLYWILSGAFAGPGRDHPVIDPLVAGALAVGVGLTVVADWARGRSWLCSSCGCSRTTS